jgi:hypothetical protein
MSKKNTPRNAKPQQPAEQAEGSQPFQFLRDRFSSVQADTSSALGDDAALRHVPFLLFLTLLGLVYIANSHYAEDVAGQIIKAEREVKNLQMEYSTLKYEYMTASTKEDVAAKLDELGLVPNDKLITKITVPKSDR